jgi:hypothetical protein
MIYGNIVFEDDERSFADELLQSAMVRNAESLSTAQDDSEAAFYQEVGLVLQSTLQAVQIKGQTPFSEEQLKLLKGVLSSSFTEFRIAYQKALKDNAPSVAELKREWVIRDRFSLKLDAPFAADTSWDAEIGLTEED